MTEKERPTWYASRWRGGYDWKKNKQEVKHTKPIRCPYCGHVMTFHTFSGYEIHASDWYWQCNVCLLRLPNNWNFSKADFTSYRKGYRDYLEKAMKDSKDKYDRLQKLYKCYGRYFTPEEKRDRLIETIEEHKPQKSLE